MSAVPVVAAQVTTRTVREAVDTDGNWFPAPSDVWHGSFPNERRDRIVPEDVWTVLDEAPGDLTVPCPDCDSSGEDPADTWSPCPTCDGTGAIVRVYVAEEQWRPVWADKWTNEPPTVRKWNDHRRQVIRWVATKADAVPVCHADEPPDEFPYIVAYPPQWFYWKRGSSFYDVGDLPEPWAADLRPGQTVLHLGGLQPVNPPITQMVREETGRVTGLRWGAFVPLSVPSGTLTRIELP